uniref:BPTI/Kunitz inhibitor domain-containing protein n=1 Tax=Monopterus albus TaxID=43700 RepID=A0A3Q3IMQ1_MONAL
TKCDTAEALILQKQRAGERKAEERQVAPSGPDSYNFNPNKESKCSRFWYGGCGGNENRFETRRECENLCQFRWKRCPRITGTQRTAGTCLLWFFDKHIAACSPFWYGGCGGNANRFNTESECFWTCGSHSFQPVHCKCFRFAGGCMRQFQNECFRFWYGGCGGNENRFRTQEDLVSTCCFQNKRLKSSQISNQSLCNFKFSKTVI